MTDVGWMKEDVSLCLGVDETAVSSVEASSIVGVLLYHPQLKTVKLQMLWVQLVPGVVADDLQRVHEVLHL